MKKSLFAILIATAALSFNAPALADQPTEPASSEYSSEVSTEAPSETPSETSTEAPTSTEKETETTKPAHVHSYKTSLKRATTKSSGKRVEKCSCGKVKSTTTIPRIKTARLQATTYTYSGKAKSPVASVIDIKGTKLKKNRDYTVKYSGTHKNVGAYTAKITFKGNYAGSKSLKFKILPKGTSISSIKKGWWEGAKKISWKKVSSQISGYEIQYSTNKKFASKVTYSVKAKSSSTTKTIERLLTTGNTYYTRIRTYKYATIKGKRVTYYSKWSPVKSFKTKNLYVSRPGEKTWTDPYGNVWTDKFSREMWLQPLSTTIQQYNECKIRHRTPFFLNYLKAINCDNFYIAGSACLGTDPYNINKNTLVSKITYRTWLEGDGRKWKLEGYYYAIPAGTEKGTEEINEYEMALYRKLEDKYFKSNEKKYGWDYARAHMYANGGFVGIYLIDGAQYDVYFNGYTFK